MSLNYLQMGTDNTMEERIKTGRIVVLIIIGAIMSISLISIITYNFSIGSWKIGAQAIRFFLTLVLCYCLYKGYQWSRITIIILYALGALGSIPGIFTITQYFFLGLVSLMITMIYGASCILLLASKDIKEFMQYQKRTRLQLRNSEYNYSE